MPYMGGFREWVYLRLGVSRISHYLRIAANSRVFAAENIAHKYLVFANIAKIAKMSIFANIFATKNCQNQQFCWFFSFLLSKLNFFRLRRAIFFKKEYIKKLFIKLHFIKNLYLWLIRGGFRGVYSRLGVSRISHYSQIAANNTVFAAENTREYRENDDLHRNFATKNCKNQRFYWFLFFFQK